MKIIKRLDSVWVTHLERIALYMAMAGLLAYVPMLIFVILANNHIHSAQELVFFALIVLMELPLAVFSTREVHRITKEIREAKIRKIKDEA